MHLCQLSKLFVAAYTFISSPNSSNLVSIADCSISCGSGGFISSVLLKKYALSVVVITQVLDTYL